MTVPFLLHWKRSGVVPVATTVKVAVSPTATVSFVGCVVMLGPTVVALTMSVDGSPFMPPASERILGVMEVATCPQPEPSTRATATDRRCFDPQDAAVRSLTGTHPAPDGAWVIVV